MFKKSFFLLFMVLFFSVEFLLAAPAEPQSKFGPRPLDGVYIEALQTYSVPKSNYFGFDFGIWPIQPYYNGFSLNFNYIYFHDKNQGWEVLNLSYLFTVDTGLTTELADTYKVDPKSIERVNYVLSSNYLLTMAYGKFILFSDNIRYFRSNLIAGPAIISSNTGTDFGLSLGVSFETFVDDRFSWKVALRDNIAFAATHPNNVVLTVGTSYGF